MKRRILFFVLSLAAIAAFLGCHAGGNSPLAPNNGETVVSPETRTVGANGRFDDITFPSGAVIKCPNDSTFQEGVKVTAAEQKVPVITDNSGKFSYIYVYNISAVLPSDNTLTADVPVNTIEKPISVTIPNDSTAGTCYIGTRASDKDPWRYSLATDGINSNARFMRLSSNPSKTCTFNLFRLNIEFRLFVFDNESKKDEVQVDTIAIEPAEDVEIKDGKYTGKLTVKLNVEGENLNGLKAEDLIAKITYRSENQQGANIDFTTNKVDSSDKAVTGSYEHSFEVSNIKVENTIGNTAELSFELNLDGVSLDDFPKDFLVEFYSKGSDENTRPFEYTQSFGFETKNQDNPDNPDPDNPDPDNPTVTDYKITYDLDGGQLAEGVTNPSSYNEDSGTIVLKNPTKDGYTFLGWTGSNGDTPQTSVEITNGSTGDRSYKANWQQNAPNTYTLTLVAGTGIASVDDNKAYQADESITLNYTLIDGYQFDKWSDSEGNAVTSPFTMPAKAVTLTANAKAITYNINYNLDNGQLTKDNPSNYTVETESFTLINPTKDYYDFLGWSGTGLTGNNNTTVTVSKGSTGAREYTANYTPTNYTITYNNIDGAIFATANPTIYNVETETFTLTNPTRTGCEFLGWTYEGQTTPQLEVIITKGSTTGVKSFTANWKLNLTLAIAQDDGAIIDGNNNPPLYYTKATFTMTPTFAAGTVMTDTKKSNILSAIIVKDSAGTKFENATATWNNESKIALSFLKDLTASTTFTISFGEIDGVNLTCEPKTFKTFYYKGKGSWEVPYQVENAVQLDLVRNYLSSHFKQMDDIVLTGNWLPIGDYSNQFTGNYDGNNKTISNLAISFESTNNEQYNSGYIGLFGCNSGSISNLSVDSAVINLNVNSLHEIGCFLGQNLGGTLTNCNVKNSIINVSCADDVDVGGICGDSMKNGTYNGTIANCKMEDLTINVSGAGNVSAGGICGYQSGNGNSISWCNIKNTTISGSTTGSQRVPKVGGICGYSNFADIYNCSVVKDSGNHKINGSCSNYSSYTGGICGSMIGNITSCYVKGYDIEGIGNYHNYVGGICGEIQSSKTILKSYVESVNLSSSGHVTMGGICGYSLGNANSCYIKNSSISGSSNNSNSCVGGICGYIYSSKTMSSSYFYNGSIDFTGSGNFGYLAGKNLGTVTDNFTSLSGSLNLVGTGNGVTNSYDGISSLSKFTTDNENKRIWSDDLDYRNDNSFNDANSVWKNYDFTNFPPTLK